MAKKITKVKPYVRKNKFGETYTVKSHKRKNRAKGGKIHYTQIGTFFVAHDELGNFRGSRVVPKKKKNKSKKALRKNRPVDDFSLEEKFYAGKLGYEDLLKQKKNKMNGGLL